MKIITSKDKEEISKLKSRGNQNFDLAIDRVMPIIRNVKIKGDKALFDYTEKFDNVQLNKHTIKLTKEEIKRAYNLVSPKTIRAIKSSVKNIARYSKLQFPRAWQKKISKGITL